jgi:hypothetical protein
MATAVVNPPIACKWPGAPSQTAFGAGVDLTNPANWECAVPPQTGQELQIAFGAGAIAALVLLPGWWKVAALPLAFLWFTQGIENGGGL